MPYINLQKEVETWSMRLLYWCTAEIGGGQHRLCVVGADKRQAFELCRDVLGIERADGTIWITDTSVILVDKSIFIQENQPETFITSKNGASCFMGLKARCLYRAYPIAFYGVAIDNLDVLVGVVKFYQLALALTPLSIVQFGPVWVSEEQLHEPSKSNGHFPQPAIGTNTHTLSKRGHK